MQDDEANSAKQVYTDKQIIKKERAILFTQTLPITISICVIFTYFAKTTKSATNKRFNESVTYFTPMCQRKRKDNFLYVYYPFFAITFIRFFDDIDHL